MSDGTKDEDEDEDEDGNGDDIHLWLKKKKEWGRERVCIHKREVSRNEYMSPNNMSRM